MVLRMHRNAIVESKELKRPRRPSRRLPQLFGRGGRDRALIALAANGPMHVRELARIIGSDSSKTFLMVEHLIETGIVVKRDLPGYRKLVALNKNLDWTYYQLRDLLLALDKKWPAKRTGIHVQPREMWHGAVEQLEPKHLDLIFQSPVRSRTLLFIAALGMTNMSVMYNALGIGGVSALYAVNHWEREGVVNSRQDGKNRWVFLNPKFVVAEPLRRLLMTLVNGSQEYQDLIGTERPRIDALLNKLDMDD
jgi:hypothetical protein